MDKLRRLGLAWIGLLLLLALTIAAASFDLGAGNLMLNMGIALAKAAIIAVIFMQIAAGDRLIGLAALVAVLWLSLIFFLPLVDYLTR